VGAGVDSWLSKSLGFELLFMAFIPEVFYLLDLIETTILNQIDILN
jgi:hypothetical protein